MNNDVKDELEMLIMRLEELSSTTNVSRSTFEHDNAFDDVSPQEVAGTFRLIARNIDEIRDKTYAVLESIH